MAEPVKDMPDPEIMLSATEVVEIKPAYAAAHPQTVFLGGLFVLAMLWACSIAAEIIIPVILAFILKLVMYPVMRGFERVRLPRILGAILIISMLLGSVAGIATVLSGPAMEWAQDLPREFPKMKERLEDLRNPIEPLQKVLSDAQEMTTTTTAGTTVVTLQQATLPERILAGTGTFITGFVETLLVLFFLLIAGDTFLRRLVEILPTFTDKKQAINISNQMEKDMSAYLITITFMNAIVGGATAIAMYACGVEDPILWGIVAFLLNYAPIVGPLAGAVLFGMVGLMLETSLDAAILPALLYLGIHVIESQFVTPLLLARHFTLNPVLVILSLIFFYWMWGIPGAILSTPIIAILKIVCDNVVTLKPLGHFIEG